MFRLLFVMAANRLVYVSVVCPCSLSCKIPFQWYRLSDIECVSVHKNFTKLRQGRRDYSFHGYGELCTFVYCLLMKTRVVVSLRGIHEWEKYMSIDAISSFPVVSAETILANADFGKILMTKKTGELPEFRAQCRQFSDRLIVVIVGSVSVMPGVSRCLYRFCLEILFEGDDSGVFALFTDLCRLLEECNLITAEESRCAVDELSSYVNEKRVQHRSSGQSACAIEDIIEHLMGDFSFQSRVRLLRIFKQCCLTIETPGVVYSSV